MFDEIPQPCIVSYNAMLDSFAKSGDMGSAISIFVRMPKRDVYSWTSVINGYGRNDCFREAISLFTEMMVDEDVIYGFLRPNEATFVSVLSSCANLDDKFAMYNGKQIHGYMVRSQKGVKYFHWNSIDSILWENGESQALDMFEMMKTSALCPNEVTFVGVLSACARKKLVDFGLELFQSMSRDFAIMPRMEHYGCIVDLLGRAGLLKEAYEFVASMPFEADASVLGALLGACRVHGDVDLGNEVGRRLLEMQPDHCGRYVLLSSIYAGAEIWDHAAALRKAMAHAGIQKVPAFSITD
ncbi:putative pentatricopeptide repeat-containing protein [Sesamum angolense]|uniref:Pentatricopeptide repeat-containing protein n=1 Tax=Sesamum angolense TaxID=2727404 RepID=A0AAE1W943_9LAMI|nr:putative pentatricopeptide repeat-containing protein [Sesamum angolense]